MNEFNSRQFRVGITHVTGLSPFDRNQLLRNARTHNPFNIPPLANTGKQALAVSTLEGLAWNLLGQNVVACAVMDARCEQVYTALFDVCGERVTRLTEDAALKIADLGEQLGAYPDKPVVFVGDGAEKCAAALGYPAAAPLVRFQSAASVALCAEASFNEAKLLDAQQLLPVYLRLPQAERELRAKNARR